MSFFPRLKTGSVAQYPVGREVRLRNEAVRFVDGGYQRYRDSGRARLRWEIRLDLLDEGELAALAEFVTQQAGAFGSFTFTDPWDGQDYDGCRLEGDAAAFLSTGEMHGSTVLVVVR